MTRRSARASACFTVMPVFYGTRRAGWAVCGAPGTRLPYVAHGPFARLRAKAAARGLNASGGR